MRTRLPEGSRNAQSRAPQGWDTGSWSTSAPDARTFSNVVSRSSAAEDRRLQRPLRHERQEGVALGLRTTAVRLGQDDVDVLPRGADGDPAEAVGRDVVADLEAERVAVEAERGVGVVDGDEHGGDGDCHATTVRAPTRRVLLRSCSVSGAQTDLGGPPRSRRDHAHARRNDLEVAVVARAVLRRRLADDLGEARAERAERRTTDGDAGVGDRHPLTQEGLRTLDASRHEIGVGRLAVRRTELAREVRGRHERGTRHGRDIERLRVVAVHEVARPAQVHEVGDLLRRHADDGTRSAHREDNVCRARKREARLLDPGTGSKRWCDAISPWRASPRWP